MTVGFSRSTSPALVPGSPLNAAFGVIGFLSQEFAAAAITVRGPGGCAHHRVLAAIGYSSATLEEIATRLVGDRTVLAAISEAAPSPVFWADVRSARAIPTVRDVLIPAGFREGSSVSLERDRLGSIAMLHVSLVDPDQVDDARPVVERSAGSCRRIMAALHESRRTRLSARETQVLALVADGRSNAQIAEDLGIAKRTVATHLESVFIKTGSHSRANAVAAAVRLGWLAGS